jgi:hypothetical protein
VVPVALIIVGGMSVSVALLLIVADTASLLLVQILIAGGLLLAGGIAWVRSVKPTFHVTIASSSSRPQQSVEKFHRGSWEGNVERV